MGPASAAPRTPQPPIERKPKPTAVPVSAPQPPALPPEETGEYEPGGIERATVAFIESMPFADDENDPRTLTGKIAIMLARRIDQSGAMPAVVRELRTLLAQISDVPSQAPGAVDDARYHRALRRFETVLSRL